MDSVTDDFDFLGFYDLESYLVNRVGPPFRDPGDVQRCVMSRRV